MKKPLPPSRTAPQFVVRFPDDEMRDRIKEAADANKRSMNAEIVARLEESLGAKPPSDLTHLLKSLQFNLRAMEAKYYVERALAYRFANALNYVREYGAIPLQHEPGTEPLMSLVDKSLNERKNSYSIAGELLTKLSQDLQEVELAAIQKEMPHPDQAFEDAVNGPLSDDPKVREEQERRANSPLEAPVDKNALIGNLGREPSSPKPPRTPPPQPRKAKK